MHELEKACFSLPWSLSQCEDAFSQKAFAAFGIWRGGQLAAYISLYHLEGEMEILNLAVMRQERRQGLGRRLLDMILQVGRKMGMQKAILEVRSSNQAAINLYRNAGFRLAGSRRRYYPDTGEDALIFQHGLEPPAASRDAGMSRRNMLQ